VSRESSLGHFKISSKELWAGLDGPPKVPREPSSSSVGPDAGQKQDDAPTRTATSTGSFAGTPAPLPASVPSPERRSSFSSPSRPSPEKPLPVQPLPTPIGLDILADGGGYQGRVHVLVCCPAMDLVADLLIVPWHILSGDGFALHSRWPIWDGRRPWLREAVLFWPTSAVRCRHSVACVCLSCVWWYVSLGLFQAEVDSWILFGAVGPVMV
jgi:hypothetical protein